MKLQPKFVWERFPTAIKIDIIPLFDVSRHRHGDGVIGRSMLDVHKFPFSIKPAVFLAAAGLKAKTQSETEINCRNWPGYVAEAVC